MLLLKYTLRGIRSADHHHTHTHTYCRSEEEQGGGVLIIYQPRPALHVHVGIGNCYIDIDICRRRRLPPSLLTPNIVSATAARQPFAANILTSAVPFLF